MPERLFMMPSTSIPLSQSEICWSSASKGRYLLYDQPKSPDRSGTRVMPMRATPPPAISCFMPWDFAPGLSLPVYAPLRSAQSRRPPDVVRPSSRLIAPQMPRPAPSATTRVCSTPTALLKNAIDKSSLLDAGELPREMVMGSAMDPGKQKCPRPVCAPAGKGNENSQDTG